MTATHFINVTCDAVSAVCPVENSIYGYAPASGFNIFFTVFFAVFATIHAILALRFRTYFFGYLLTVGCISEALGYGGRLMLHNNAYDATGFELQISCLIFAPSFVAAGIYVDFKRMVEHFGAKTLRPSPRSIVWIFISCDLLSLTLQAVGGGLAGSAGENVGERSTGTDLMLTGIVFQVFTMLAFCVLAVEHVVRVAKTQHQPFVWSDKGFMVAVGIATACVLTRCIYRIPELSGGWGNSIMRDQQSFIVLEGFMIVAAVFVLTLAHPGVWGTSSSATIHVHDACEAKLEFA